MADRPHTGSPPTLAGLAARYRIPLVGAALVGVALCLLLTPDHSLTNTWPLPGAVFAGTGAALLAAMWIAGGFIWGFVLARLIDPGPRRLDLPPAWATATGFMLNLALVHAAASVHVDLLVAAQVLPLLVLGALLAARRRRVTPATEPAAEEVPASPRRGPGGWWLLLVPALSVGIAAALPAPGWLWTSTEFGAYDVLSYHLQLPKEWLDAGRLETLSHNVYSALPSFMEASFLHLARIAAGMVSGDGLGDPVLDAARAAHLLHFAFAIAAALTLGAWVRRRLGSGTAAAPAVVTAAGVVLALPWTLVVATIAYNEMPLLLALAAGLLAIDDIADERDRRGWRLGLVLGVLVGTAGGAKLTAVGLVAAPLAVAIALLVPIRRWVGVAAAGTLAALLVLGPYFLRNLLATGNPVFPFATGVFGTGWWSEEQVARWNAAHVSAGGLGDRFADAWTMLFDPSTPEGGQWALLWWIGPILAVVALLQPKHRRHALVLVLMLVVQVAFWMTVTHRQSRFLLPTVVPWAGLIALTLAPAPRPERVGRRAARVAPAVGPLIVLALSLASLRLYLGQRDGSPAHWIDPGPDLLTGAIFDLPRDLEAARAAARQRPEIAINLFHADPDDGALLLVGGATPLYLLHPDLRYHVTWDASPLGEEVRDAPGEPAEWAAGLRARGIETLLVDHAELHRLSVRDEWYDPDVTPEIVATLLDAHARPIMGWPPGAAEPRIGLYELRPPR